MASLPSSIFDLFEGNPAQQEQEKFGNLANYETGLGENLATAGAGEELGILSGDPTRIAQAEAPEITAQRQQIEQQNLSNANFGTRSGGTAASTQAADAAGRANIIDLTGNLIGNTAGAAVGQGSNFLSGASSNLGNEANLAEERRKQVTGDIGGIAEGAAAIAAPFFGGGDAIGGPDMQPQGPSGDVFSATAPYEGTEDTTPFTSSLFESMQGGASPEITPFY